MFIQQMSSSTGWPVLWSTGSSASGDIPGPDDADPPNIDDNDQLRSATPRSADETPPEVFLHLLSFAFDSSVVGLYWTLAAGGRAREETCCPNTLNPS